MLLEREDELAQVAEALRAAAAGDSSLVLLTGPMGIGRTALLQQLPMLADGAEIRVLRANAAPVEQDFTLGVVRQLFDSLLTGAPGELHEFRLGEEGDLYRTVFSDDVTPRDDGGTLTMPEEALYCLRSALAAVSADSPLLILVDDLQWADAPSLRWLAFLVKRLHGLRAVVVCGLRDGYRRPGDPLLREVVDAARRVLRPAPLSLGATKEVIHEQFGVPGDEEFARACHETSAGNPLFLKSVLADLAAGGLRPTAGQVEAVRSLRPALLRERLAGSLRVQPRPARDLAAAIAVLGGQAEPDLLARLAGLDPIGFLATLRDLHEVGLLAAEQEPRFLHRVVQDAVESSMTVAERERLHDAAAALLYHNGRPAELVAAQLMAVTNSGHPWAVEVLRAAADTALRRGAPRTAARYLRRALLDGSLAGEGRARLLIDLATAERGFDPAACERHISQAIPLLTTPRLRAAAALRISPTIVGLGPPSAIDLLHQVAEDLGPATSLEGTARDVALRLEARLRHAGHEDPAELAAAVERLSALGEEPALITAAERELTAVLLNSAVLTARWSAAEVSRLANRILEREPATSEQVHTPLPLVVIGLVAADSVRGISSWLAMEQQTRRQGGTVADALVNVQQAMVLSARGRVSQAREYAERAVRLAEVHWQEAGVVSTLALTRVALDLQDPVLIERILDGPGRRRSSSLALTATLQFAKAAQDAGNGRWTSALETLLACGRQLEASGWRNPVLFAWRPWAAELHRRVGDPGAAGALAEEELLRAKEWGAPVALGRALRVKARLIGGDQGVRLLRESVDVLRASADGLELARTLLLLGRQLRSGGEAAAVLQEAGALAAACGVPWLVERIRAADGSGASAAPPEAALTRTERTVVSLVGRGLTNQEAAAELGVTSRAVEKHLTSSYRKLGVSGRRELIELLPRMDS
ncbi:MULTISPECIES: AAA family ATPase [Streptomyces]|uniref:ATP-binding protein n=1 Tax=Streptomyces TaxID=1883 RepID=UPI000F77A9EE|nr:MULTISPECIES: LuxR family transcriptional regulator [unclassified Streptomyces]QTI90052.1 AAA family ATPase [Streptomyces sp. AgN23]RSS42951.1 LuxR family transcriptional regulator [Streptomyces sp. WAC05858]WTA85976.1 AAA family ATPase [Streptomyces antimycoticus]WTB03465.1 AAA family ATPase [Streptomyces antimycoticus]